MYSTVTSKDQYLRPYQQEAKDSIFKAWDTVNNVMLQMPTGTGKTVLFSSIIRDIHNWMTITKDFKKVLIIVHRTELIEQTRDKLGSQYHVYSGIIAGNYTRDLRPQVQIASIQTLTHPANESLAKKLNVGFIIIDEAHHALASSYQKLWTLYPEAKKLGVTATPWRMNHAGFTDLFDQLIQSWTIRRFIEKKYLAKFKYYSIRPTSEEQRAIDGITEFDIEGDYKISAMEQAMDNGRIRANLLDSYRKYAKGKRGIIYAITREHGKKICSDFRKAGVNIDYIDSTTKPQDRQRIVEQFRDGDIEVLVNVDIFSEGFDCPALDFVQMARPTRSLVKYLQQVGRALRPNGRKQAIILDNVGMFKRFGLPDANRKWAYHFKGIDVEERGFENETDPEYTSNVRRLNDISEGSEDMVLLNGKAMEQIDEQDEVITVEETSVEQLMEDKLNYLGIPHGSIVSDKGLIFDFIEKEDYYVYRQISIKYNFRHNDVLSIPKDSILGRLCKEFGPHFSQEIKVDEKGDYYFQNGISYTLGNINLRITDTLDFCHQYDDNHKAPVVGSFQQDEYDISKYNDDLHKLLEIKNDPKVEKSIEQLKKSGRFNPTNEIFYNGQFAYFLLINDKVVSLRKLIIEQDCIKSILVAKADKDSCLYKSCNKNGGKAIRYIKHFGGKFSIIMFDAEDNSGIYINSFDGETMSCYYDFEVKNRYLYAKEIGSESTIDTISTIPLQPIAERENTQHSVVIKAVRKTEPFKWNQTYECSNSSDYWYHFVKESNTTGSCYMIMKQSGNVITIHKNKPLSGVLLTIDVNTLIPVQTPDTVSKALEQEQHKVSSPQGERIKFRGYDLAHKFFMKQKNGGFATGCYNPGNNCFTVAKGCCFPVVVSDSFSRNNARDALIRSSKKTGDYYVTTKEHEFDSPSTAACIIKGYSTNGFVEWKTSDGKTLKEIYKK